MSDSLLSPSICFVRPVRLEVEKGYEQLEGKEFSHFAKKVGILRVGLKRNYSSVVASSVSVLKGAHISFAKIAAEPTSNKCFQNFMCVSMYANSGNIRFTAEVQSELEKVILKITLSARIGILKWH